MVQTRFQRRRSNNNFKDSPQDNIENVPQVPQQQPQSPRQPQSIPSLTRNASREVLIEVPYGGVDKIGMLLEQLNDDECSTLDNIRERWWPSVRSRLKGMPRHLPKQKDTRPTLVLDVDETLLHTFMRQNKIPNDPDYVVYDENNEHILMAGMLRPGVSEFLQWAAQHFELVMWTAGDDQYARLAVELLDPERTLFEHILTRRVCIDLHFTMPHEVLHVKDLCALGRDLSRTFMVDNNPHTAALNLSNLIPIKPYLGDGDDRELIQLRAFLNSMLARVEYCDVRLILHREFDLKRELRERVCNWRKSAKKGALQEQ